LSLSLFPPLEGFVNTVVGEDSVLEWQQGIGGGADSSGIELDVEGGDEDYGMELTMNHQTVNRRF